MSELKDLIRAVNTVRSRKKEFLLATLVRASDASTRRPGTRILLTEDRWIAGAVSGEFGGHDLVQRALWLIRENAPVVITLDAHRGDDLSWALGFGCRGEFEVLIERVGPSTKRDPLAFIERSMQAQLRGGMATVCRSESRSIRVGSRLYVTAEGTSDANGLPPSLHQTLLEDCREAMASGYTGLRTYVDAGREIQVLVEAIHPPPRLFLFGAGHEAAPVANLARTVGWDVYVCVRRARAETRSRFAPADALVVASAENIRTLIRSADRAVGLVMTHDVQNDKDALALLLRSSVRFIGVPGPRSRTAKLLEEIGYDIDREPRIHAPVGAGMAGETPQEVALALIAEVQSALNLPLYLAPRAHRSEARATSRMSVRSESVEPPPSSRPSSPPPSQPPPTSRRTPVDFEPASGTPMG